MGQKNYSYRAIRFFSCLVFLWPLKVDYCYCRESERFECLTRWRKFRHNLNCLYLKKTAIRQVVKGDFLDGLFIDCSLKTMTIASRTPLGIGNRPRNWVQKLLGIADHYSAVIICDQYYIFKNLCVMTV